MQFQKIKAGKFEFHPQYWSETSDEAKDLISKMLTVDPKKRHSAKQLLDHAWLHKPDEHLSSKDLSATQLELRRFNARRRFKAAVTAVIAAQRIIAIDAVRRTSTLDPTAVVVVVHALPPSNAAIS